MRQREARQGEATMMRRIALALALLFAAVFAAGYGSLRASLPILDGEAALRGLTANVTVERDEFGVPTVRGESRHDVARAIGFLHAQDRFFQMDLLRRRAAGELSALLGRAALPTDQRHRLHRMRHIAAEALAQLPEADRTLLAAYAEGVNEGLARLAVAPFEYLLLRASPQPWTPADSLLVMYSMYFQLADAEGTLKARKALLGDCLPADMAAFIGANDAEWAAAIDGGRIVQVPLPDAASYDLRRLTGVDFEVSRAFAATLQIDHEMPAGSNSWVVAGSRTRDGRALVANDMHLALRVPNIWYPARLIVPAAALPIDVSGVTLPGAPMVVAGSNRHIAWGFTNSYGDWTDRISLTLAPDDPERYRTPQGLSSFVRHNEVIEIKGDEPVVFSMRWSIWGPVVRDHRDRPIALRWLAHDAAAMNMRIDALAQATHVDQALDIAATMGVPPQNIVVGDAQGNIGWTIAGRIPRRQNYDPGLPAFWIDAGTGWNGWLATHEYPRIVNPQRGVIWTANNQVVTADALAVIGDGGFWHGARARQIRDALHRLDRASEKDMLAIQLDDRAQLLARWKDLLLSTLTDEALAKHPRAREFRETVAGWSGRASADSAAFRLVHAFRARLRDVVFSAVTAPCRKLDPQLRLDVFRQFEGPLWALLETRPMHLLNPRYATWDAQIEAIALETVDYFDRHFKGPLASRVWGERNTLAMHHPLSSSVPGLGFFLDMPRSPLAGDRTVPRLQSPSHGASERFAVAPGRENDGYLHMPGGQSGHPLSPYFRKGHEAWVRGEPKPFLPGPREHALTLMPPVAK